MSVRRFKVTVNGREFEVEVEEIGGAPNVLVSKPAPAKGVSPAAPKPVQPAMANGSVTAPIPGKVLSVEVKTGDAIAMGQKLLTLESMKIENPILCPRDGVVQNIHVTVGAQVQTGELLITIG